MTGVFEFLAAVASNHTFEVVLGAIIAIVFAIFVENLRRPRLRFSGLSPVDMQRQLANGPIMCRVVRVVVTRSLPAGIW